MATICARWVVENALVLLFEGLAGAHFSFFIAESHALAFKCCSNRFENTSMKTAHVQPSGGHSDCLGAIWEAMAHQESIFKMFVRF